MTTKPEIARQKRERTPVSFSMALLTGVKFNWPDNFNVCPALKGVQPTKQHLQSNQHWRMHFLLQDVPTCGGCIYFWRMHLLREDVPTCGGCTYLWRMYLPVADIPTCGGCMSAIVLEHIHLCLVFSVQLK